MHTLWAIEHTWLLFAHFMQADSLLMQADSLWRANNCL